MAELKLVIGSKTYSSWSLRPWLLLRYHNVAFREIPIALNQAEFVLLNEVRALVARSVDRRRQVELVSGA